jgi:CO dehydrogenase/acetyl-CoA synthase delta subunit
MISFSPIYDTLAKITGIAKGLLDTHFQVQINDVAIELQGAIIDLQSKVAAVPAEYQEALQAKEETEKKLVAYERWEQESARYSLQ